MMQSSNNRHVSQRMPQQFLQENAKHLPNGTALIADGMELTWSDMYRESLRYAAVLNKVGVNEGDRVAYATSDNVEGFIMLHGIWLAGCIASPFNSSLPEKFLTHMLNTLRPNALIRGEGITLEAPKGCVCLDGTDCPSSHEDFAYSTPNTKDTGVILFSSGSTGLPKGIANSYEALASNAELTAEFLSVSESDRILINTPHYYTSAICHLLTMFSRKASVVTTTGFLFGKTFLELVEKKRCTGFGGAPTHFVKILSGLEEGQPYPLRFMMSSGDHLSDDLAHEARRVFPETQVFRVYGLSEVAGRLCMLDPQHLDTKPQSTGIPLPGMSVRILNDDGREVPPGELGEIHVRGAMLSNEYFGNPEKSANLIAEQGFATGDVGRMDEDGFVYVVGRLDDMFKSGGEKVSSLIIQQELTQLGLFDDVAVIPVEEDILGKAPKVFYIPKNGMQFDRFKVIRMLSDKLPQSHIPRLFMETTTIPRTGSGKVDRKALMRIHKGGAA